MAVDIEEDVFIVGVGVPMISFEIGKNTSNSRSNLKSTTLQRRVTLLRKCETFLEA